MLVEYHKLMRLKDKNNESDFYSDEWWLLQALNRQLDELDRVLDTLEEKNDEIHSQLRELLADSKQVKQLGMSV